MPPSSLPSCFLNLSAVTLHLVTLSMCSEQRQSQDGHSFAADPTAIHVSADPILASLLSPSLSRQRVAEKMSRWALFRNGDCHDNAAQPSVRNPRTAKCEPTCQRHQTWVPAHRDEVRAAMTGPLSELIVVRPVSCPAKRCGGIEVVTPGRLPWKSHRTFRRIHGVGIA